MQQPLKICSLLGASECRKYFSLSATMKSVWIFREGWGHVRPSLTCLEVQRDSWSLLTAPKAGCWKSQSSVDLESIILCCGIENNSNITCKDNALSILCHSFLFNSFCSIFWLFPEPWRRRYWNSLYVWWPLIHRPLMSNESLNLTAVHRKKERLCPMMNTALTYDYKQKKFHGHALSI